MNKPVQNIIATIFTDLTGLRKLESKLLNQHVINFTFFLSTTLVSLYTPACFAMAIYVLFTGGIQSNHRLIYGTYLILEILFYFYCWIIYNKLNATKVEARNKITEEERKAFITNWIQNNYINPTMITNWFNPIRKEMVSFSMVCVLFAWFFYDEDFNELNLNQQKYIKNLIKKVEVKNNMKFPKMDLCDVKRSPMRLTLDPVRVQHKPMIFYVIISYFQASCSVLLLLLGFQSNYVKSTGYNYWIYEPSNSTEQPIFFVHGIGLGIAMYIKKIYDLKSTYPNRKIILLELPYISLMPITKVNSIEDTLITVDTIMDIHNLKACSFIGHSYGTIICTWIIKYRKHYVDKLTLVDPVCFAMWNPALIRNFMYNQNSSFINRMCEFFVSKDLFIGNTIGRHFFWYKNILLQDAITKPTIVYLSKFDFIIDASYIYEYLKPLENDFLQVKLIEHLTHGAYLFSRDHSDLILSQV